MKIDLISPEVLVEAAAIASYASGRPIVASLASIEAGLDDPAVAAAILAVAEHVCHLRHMRDAPTPRISVIPAA